MHVRKNLSPKKTLAIAIEAKFKMIEKKDIDIYADKLKKEYASYWRAYQEIANDLKHLISKNEIYIEVS